MPHISRMILLCQSSIENVNNIMRYIEFNESVTPAFRPWNMIRAELLAAGWSKQLLNNLIVNHNARHYIQAINQSKIIFENDTYVVVIPQSGLAAGFWSANTFWQAGYGYEYGQYPSIASYFDSKYGPGCRPLIFFDKKTGETRNTLYYFKLNQYNQFDTTIIDCGNNDISGDEIVEEQIALLSDNDLSIIQSDCLSTITFTNGRLVIAFDSVSELIACHGDEPMKWAADIIINGNYADFGETPNNFSDIYRLMPPKFRTAIVKYLKNTWPTLYSNYSEPLSDDNLADITALIQIMTYWIMPVYHYYY